MSNGGSGRKKTSQSKVEKSDDYEVDQLLQSAQDELLLKLSVDSHMSRVSPDYLLSDLDRRFQALKSRPTNTTTTGSKPATVPKSSQQQQQQPQPQPPPDPLQSHDLFARFAALKASSSSSVNSNGVRDNATMGPAVFDQRDDDEDDEEDEVEKIIRWAKDAARLDPSPPSDDDVDDDRDHYESDQDSEKAGKMDGPVKGKRK